MPEAPEEFYERVKDSLRMPPVEEWDTFPFDGEMTPRALLPPAEKERPRHGEGGVDCRRCSAPDADYIWTSERWRLHALQEPSGLPVVVLLEPREHFGELGDLPDDLAAELGVLLARIERAVLSVGAVARVHIGKWGEGGEHLHWWFMARPARMSQMASSFAEIWDDVLPPVPEEIWRANLDAVVAALEE